MSFASIAFPEFPRAALRSALRDKADVPAHHVDEIVDLACHAAASGRTSMLTVLDATPDMRIKICALGLAAGLLASDISNLVKGLEKFADANGIRTSRLVVEHEGTRDAG